MNDLLECWHSFEGRLDAARKYCILTDFDGTLVPLAPAPGLAGLPGKVLQALEALSGHPNVTVGVVSGRALPDLILRIGLDHIWYVGNHGFEVRSPWGDEHRYYTAEDARYLASVGDQLAAATGGIQGVLLEHKGPIVAVHYRRVAPERVAEVQLAFLTVLRSHTPRLMMCPGKMVLEMRLRSNCNKGIAVRQIRRELPAGCLVVYFGDDLTDRDVFRELRRVGVSVEVGADGPPQADYRLRDPEAVLEVLLRMNEKLRRRSDASGVQER